MAALSSRTGPVKKPAKRPNVPVRNSNNDKRRMLSNPDPNYVNQLKQHVRYQGSSKHKRSPHAYGLPTFSGKRGDATLCDKDAGFQNIQAIPQLIKRGLDAGLVGEQGIIWAIADDGWIFEARITNRGTTEYHGYPVLPSEPIAEKVYKRFSEWAEQFGNQSARQAAVRCKDLYGFK